MNFDSLPRSIHNPQSKIKNSLIRLRILISILALLSLSGIRGAENDLTVEVSGLRIVALTENAAVRAFDWSSGTSVALLVKSPSGGLVQFDSKNSVLSKFTDDKNNDLLTKSAQKKDAISSNVGFSMLSKISTDGKACALEINGQNVPTKGAAAIKLEGVIAMLTATKKKEYAMKDMPIRNGSKITADNLEIVIQKVSKPEWGDEQLSLTFRATRELDEVAEICFFKADGTEIKSRRVGSSKIGVLGSLTVEWNYNLTEKVDTATIKVFVWTDLQQKKTPFNLTVNVGL
ncbi:MAG: hypothetical protein V1899_11195 [Planctomycetota bacterium]